MQGHCCSGLKTDTGQNFAFGGRRRPMPASPSARLAPVGGYIAGFATLVEFLYLHRLLLPWQLVLSERAVPSD